MNPISSPSKLPYEHYDLVVIGAGPAGLGAASHPSVAGMRVLVVDAGKAVDRRERDNPDDLTCGDGGAGLFSDGKFSFFPSSTALWSLGDRESLKDGYAWTARVLADCGMEVPPFPDSPPAADEPSGRWFLKRYPSEYLTLEQRIELIRGLVERGHGDILRQALVEDGYYSPADDSFTLTVADHAGKSRRQIAADRLIFAGGRFGPRLMDRFPFMDPVFRRLEVGFRIQQPAERAFFRECEQLDPKFKFIDRDGKTEWRTFCACRDGEAVLSNTLGLWTVSGRSDCPPTGMTNIGFNTRVLDEATAMQGWRHLEKTFSRRESHYDFPLPDVLARRGARYDFFVQVVGPDLAQRMLRGLEQLAEKFPSVNHSTTTLVGPTLEGIGCYPDTDHDLKIAGVPAWVVGDSCGKFRGITASMISGHYAAARCALAPVRAKTLMRPVAPAGAMAGAYA